MDDKLSILLPLGKINAYPANEKNNGNEEFVIATKGLKKFFNEKHVLNNINLKLKKDENLLVLGRSGTGKSVTIQCIVGLLKPDEGTLKVLGEELAELSDKGLKQLRIKTGFLFQKGSIGKLLNNDRMANDLDATVKQARTTMQNVHKTTITLNQDLTAAQHNFC